MPIYSHCSYCGTAFANDAPWPRICSHCGEITFRNPLPVCVVLVPFINGSGEPGLLAVRRAIPPKIGELALPGGYINYGETWQEAGAREVFEESGVRIDPAEITEFRVRSAPDGTLIIFGLAQPHPLEQLPAFLPNEEASERVLLTRPVEMAFGLHNEMARLFFLQARDQRK
jgi:ADP-ribose pyrophosphatase YjhB (NUDIX family)